MAIQINPLSPSLPATTGIQDPAARQFANAVAEAVRAFRSEGGAVEMLSRAAGALSGTTSGGVPPSIANWLFSSELYAHLKRAIDAVDIGAKQLLIAESAARQAAIDQINATLADIDVAREYDPLATYAIADTVKYGGALYRAIADTTGNLPTNTTYWQKIGDYTSLGDAVAAMALDITDHETRITAAEGGITAEASQRNTLAAQLRGSYTGTDAASVTQGLIYSERTARASADSAITTTLNAQIARVDSAEAAITSEATTRASADAALTTQLNTVSSVANGRNRTFRQASAPAEAVTGDLWLDSSDANKAYRYDGASWVATSDARIASNEAAIVTEATTRATNDDALVQAINTAWAVTGATQALIQSGGTIQTNWTAAQANRWGQLEAEVFTAGGQTIRAALAEEATVRANVDGGLSAQWTLKTDINGYISGFGFASTANNANPTSSFIIRADKFAMVMPGYGEHVPFAIGAFGPEFSGLTNWAGVQGAGRPADNATVGANSSNLASGIGANLLPNSDLTLSIGQWKLGWIQSGVNDITVARNLAGDDWRPVGGNTIGITRSGTPTGIWDLLNDEKIPVEAGVRYEISGRVATHRCNANLWIGWYRSDGAHIAEEQGPTITPIWAGGKALSGYGQGLFFATAPADAAYAQLRVRCSATGESNPYAWLTQGMVCRAGAGQTEPSTWSAGNFLEQITPSNVSTYIANAAIGAAQIGSINLVGNFNVKSATAGARMEMDAQTIKVYDANGVKRVQLGNLLA